MNQLVPQNRVAEDVRDKSIDVYPNPASNFFIVYNYSSGPGRTIELYDLTGRLLQKQGAVNLTTRVDVSRLPGGLYFLKSSGPKGETIRTEKMVIQR